MENNNNIISDATLHKLLNQFILSEPSTLQQEIITMQASYLLQPSTAAWTLAASKSTLLKKLHVFRLKQFLFKGFLISSSLAILSTAVLYFNYNSNNPNSDTNTNLAALSIDKDTSKQTKNDTTIKITSLISPLNTEKFEFTKFQNDAGTSQFYSNIVPGIISRGSFFTDTMLNIGPNNIQPALFQYQSPVLLDSILKFQNIKKIKVISNSCNIKIHGSTSSTATTVNYSLNNNSKKEKSNQGFKYSVIGNELIIEIEAKKKKTFGFYQAPSAAELDIEIPNLDLLEIDNHTGQISLNNIQSNELKLENEYGNVTVDNQVSNSNIVIHTGNLNMQNHIGNLTSKIAYGQTQLLNIKGTLNHTVHTGNVTAKNIDGNTNFKVEYGNINLNQIKSNLLSIDIQTGHCNLSKLIGKTLTLNMEYGNLNLTEILANITGTIQTGNINLMKNTGDIKLSTEYGNIAIQDNTGSAATSIGTGNSNLKNIKGTVSVKSTYGNIALSEISGDIKAETQTGNISAAQISLNTLGNFKNTYGNISVKSNHTMDEISCDLNTEHGKLNINKNSYIKSQINGKLIVEKGPIKILVSTQTGNVSIE